MTMPNASTLAADPSTPAECLAELANVAPQEVARNPNTGIETLRTLALDHAADVVRNPTLAVHAITSPDELFPSAPNAFAATFAILSHPACPLSLLNSAFAQNRGSMIGILLANPNLPEHFLERAFARLRDDPFDRMVYGRRFAAHPNLTPEMLAWVYPQKDIDINSGYAESPHATSEQLEWIFEHVFLPLTPDDRRYTPLTLPLARNLRTPRRILEFLEREGPRAARADARETLLALEESS